MIPDAIVSFDALLAAVLEDVASDAERAAFQAMLREHPELLDRYIRQSQMHAYLNARLGGVRAAEKGRPTSLFTWVRYAFPWAAALAVGVSVAALLRIGQAGAFKGVLSDSGSYVPRGGASGERSCPAMTPAGLKTKRPVPGSLVIADVRNAGASLPVNGRAVGDRGEKAGWAASGPSSSFSASDSSRSPGSHEISKIKQVQEEKAMMASARTVLKHTAAGLLAVAATGTDLLGNEGFWSVDAGGNWNDAASWTNTATPPNGVGDVAYLTAPLTAQRTIALTNNITLGGLVMSTDKLQLGNSVAASANISIVFDNGGAASHVTVSTVNGANGSVTVWHSLAVTDRLIADLTDCLNEPIYFDGGFKGGPSSQLDVIYQLTGGSPVIELRKNQDYTGSVRLKRAGSDSASLGFSFYDNDAIFAGGPGSIAVFPGVRVAFKYALDDTLSARFAFVGTGQQVYLSSAASLTTMTDPSTWIPEGGQFILSYTSLTSPSLYPEGKDMRLNNTLLSLNGYDNGTGCSNAESAGALILENGNRILLTNRTRADSKLNLSFTGLSRMDEATLTVSGKGNGQPLGTSVSNRIQFASGLPAETNGILPPWMVYYEQAQSGNGLFLRNGPNGLVWFDAYPATNDFSLGADTVVVVTNATVSLGGGDVSCYALKSTGQITNGRLTIESGGLILGSAFKTYTAEFLFGDGGTGDAYIHLDGFLDAAKFIYLNGQLTCRNLVKFGSQNLLFIGASNAVSGCVEIQSGGVMMDNAYALGVQRDVVMGYGTSFQMRNGTGLYSLGGLRAKGKATIQSYSTTGAKRLMLCSAPGTTNVFSGSIADGSAVVGVTVAGAGCQRFDGVNTYSGETAVTNGATLLLGEEGVLGSGTVRVFSSSVFGGSGQTTGTLALEDGAVLRVTPSSPLRVGALDCAPSATVTVDVGSVGAIEDGPVLMWSGEGPVVSPKLTLVGAPSDLGGKYVAEYDGSNQQIVVSYKRRQGTMVLFF